MNPTVLLVDHRHHYEKFLIWPNRYFYLWLTTSPLTFFSLLQVVFDSEALESSCYHWILYIFSLKSLTIPLRDWSKISSSFDTFLMLLCGLFFTLFLMAPMTLLLWIEHFFLDLDLVICLHIFYILKIVFLQTFNCFNSSKLYPPFSSYQPFSTQQFYNILLELPY